ncbi:unnamed protein product [Periconia digitata]|uniref:Uncharacterized protein n=1 Tax=Periconia digitata TaxID=1303443 RepID=A0A9W4UQI0_9PLEO|nr:unnamed protein product [Periconia digitata]
MHSPSTLLFLLTALTATTTSALSLTFYEKADVTAPETGEPKKTGIFHTCAGKTHKPGSLSPSSGCQKLKDDYWGLMIEWEKAEDNGLTVETFKGKNCCAGSPGDWYAWSDGCASIPLNVCTLSRSFISITSFPI